MLPRAVGSCGGREEAGAQWEVNSADVRRRRDSFGKGFNK